MLQTTTNINVDFNDKKYILINAKQLDKNSRFLSVACYNHGEPYSLNAGENAAYVRYRKADDYGVFNNCDIDYKGKIIVRLTEQMLAADGICYADLVIINKGDAVVDVNTGEINEIIANASVLSTMTFCIDVSEVPVSNSEIESTHEFILLNENLEKYWADFEDVMKTSKSWAVGDSGLESRKDVENTDNSKYYCEQSLKNASNAKASEQKAKTSEDNAKTSEINAKTSETNAETSEVNALKSEQNAKSSEDNAKISEINAKTSEVNAKTSETNAGISEQNAKTSETKALSSEQEAKISETSALNSAYRAQSYAVGGTGTRDGEDTNNSYYYYGLIKNIVVGLDTGFIPMGTISFSELASAEKATGYVYNISDDFVTNESFREGAGKSYTAGTNVYYTANGQWDCFGGASSPTATVDEVKDYLGI